MKAPEAIAKDQLIGIFLYFKESVWAKKYFYKTYLKAVRYSKTLQESPSPALFEDIRALGNSITQIQKLEKKSLK